VKATLVKLCQDELKPWIDAYDQEPRDKLGRTRKPTVLIAHDTRPSCAGLCEAFKTGVELLEGLLVNYGLLATPQLHYMVRCLNTSNAYGEPHESGYFEKIARAFANVWSLIEFNNNNGRYEADLYVDGANGVGADKIKLLGQALASAFGEEQIVAGPKKLNLHLFNEAKTPDDKLNHLCGADFVKVQQKPAQNLPENLSGEIRKYCSLDGDADRIVYYYLDGGKFFLLDGDKISTLVCFNFWLASLIFCIIPAKKIV
jgi:phosphoacetylglucosamine mutase